MTDVVEEKPHEAALTYPTKDAPELGDGSAREVVRGVLWLRMPLFVALPHINVWALEDGEGWTIVDTGLRSAKTVDAWRAAFSTSLAGRPITRVIATHMHPDHCGMAGWLADQFGARLWMSRLDYLTCRLMAADTGRQAPAEGVRFYKSAGWSKEALDNYKAKFGQFGESIYPLPNSYRRIEDGQRLMIGKHEWEVVTGSGHSPEHASLYCRELKLLIGGDQVLPRISSNVSVFPTEPDADPLGHWLASLERIKARVPDDVLVLPAHGLPFKGLHVRLDQLIEGHQEGLAKLQAMLTQPRRVVDIFPALFSREITGGILGMATGESFAHLNRLAAEGKAVSEADGDGVLWWRAA